MKSTVGLSVYRIMTRSSRIHGVPASSVGTRDRADPSVPVPNSIVSAIPLAVIFEFAILPTLQLYAMLHVSSVIFAGMKSMIFSAYAGAAQLLAIVMV